MLKIIRAERIDRASGKSKVFHNALDILHNAEARQAARDVSRWPSLHAPINSDAGLRHEAHRDDCIWYIYS